jgi:hypothetical protein
VPLESDQTEEAGMLLSSNFQNLDMTRTQFEDQDDNKVEDNQIQQQPSVVDENSVSFMQFEDESNQNVSTTETQSSPDNQISDVTTDQISNEAEAAVESDNLDASVDQIQEEDPVISEHIDNIDHPVECENC